MNSLRLRKLLIFGIWLHWYKQYFLMLKKNIIDIKKMNPETVVINIIHIIYRFHQFGQSFFIIAMDYNYLKRCTCISTFWNKTFQKWKPEKRPEFPRQGTEKLKIQEWKGAKACTVSVLDVGTKKIKCKKSSVFHCLKICTGKMHYWT